MTKAMPSIGRTLRRSGSTATTRAPRSCARRAKAPWPAPISRRCASSGTAGSTRRNGQVRKRIRVWRRSRSGRERNVRCSTISARMNRPTAGLYGWWREIAGAIVVLVSRLLTMPKTFWENDEFLFAEAVRSFDPSRYHPHPPGYPLYVLLGKLFNAFLHDPFLSLVALGVVTSVI